MANIGSIVERNYTNFRGIDLLNPKNRVDITRSPDCLNVWKNYDNTQGNIIQTRPGFKRVAKLGTNTINSFYIYDKNTALIHIGTKLLLWTGFPDNVADITFDFGNINFADFTFGGSTLETIKLDMADTKSYMFYFNDNIYIWDGVHYLRYNGTNLIDVFSEAFIPTTSISRKPSGGGEIYQDINLLSSKRKNTFIGDGTSTEYYLDATSITAVNNVKVNDVTVTNYTVNLTQGKVTFTTAPSVPSQIGHDNVEITFTKNVDGYKERILNCTITAVFDNRVFFSGNSDYKNAVFHCSLNNPAYVSDLDYYECGSQDNNIKSLVVGNNLLWVLKEENQNKDTIFYLTPSTAPDYGRVYPTSQGNVATGCYGKGFNYKDTIVFFSRNGLEGINGNVEYEQSIGHKSSLVDSKLTTMSNYADIDVVEYKGYLVAGVDDYIFLADYRQQFAGITGRKNDKEYEWYLWKTPIRVKFIINYMDKLYIGDENSIYQLKGTNDNGQSIESYWTTPRDNFGHDNYLKTINKRGAIAVFKYMQNGKVKIGEQTNKKTDYKLIKEYSINGFNFNNIDFSNFSFGTTENSYVVFRIKEKKIINISLKVYSDEIDKPLNLVGITLQAFLGGYVKRS